MTTPDEKLASDVAELKQRALVKEFSEGQIKVFAAMYEKSLAYTNLIVVAGYAGFFGLWSLTRPFLSKNVALVAALLMAASLITFVFFEIYKMILMTLTTQRRARALFHGDEEVSTEVFVKNIRVHEAASLRDELRLARVWPWSLGITLAFGAAGIVVLLYAFVCGLLTE